MTLVIRKIDERLLREFKAEAIRRGLTLSQAFEEAASMWLKGSALETDVDANNRAYLRMKNELDKFKGKYVVFANGAFVGAFATIQDVGKAIKSLRPRPRHAIVLRVGYDVRVRRSLEWWGGSIELERA
ncbi:MAG: hypothetical protein J7L11_05720 [Thermoprotei archaeon]|nr:hypothetical protein [Thermoprotei archaeon]